MNTNYDIIGQVYELLISVGNEYRAIMFTIDQENFVQAEQILLLNGFMKKSTKGYKKEIQKAQHILDTYYEKEVLIDISSVNQRKVVK